MALVDFTTFTEVDPNNDITVTPTKCDVSTMRRDVKAYVRKDYGADYFADFTHQLTVQVAPSDADCAVNFWGLSNGANTFGEQETNNDGLAITVNRYGAAEYQLFLFDLETVRSDYTVISTNTPYYLTVYRRGNVLTCDIYTDADRTILYDSLTVSCNETGYRYLYGVMSRDASGSAALTGYCENLDLLAIAPLEPPPWWNRNWTKRRPLAISSAGEGYTVKFNPTGDDAAVIYEHCLANGNDLRVLYWDGEVWLELDRDLVTFTSSEIKMWFKLQKVVHGWEASYDYYVYYGNSSAGTPPADKDNIYLLWDDFETDTIGTKWQRRQGTGSTISGGKLTVNASVADQKLTSIATFPRSGGIRVKAKVTLQTFGSSSVMSVAFYEGSNDYIEAPLYYGLTASGNCRVYRGNRSLIGTSITDALALSTAYIFESAIGNGGPIRYWRDEVLKRSENNNIDTGNFEVGFFGENGSVVDYDEVRVRKWCVAEPTVSGGEETNMTWWNNHWKYRFKYEIPNANLPSGGSLTDFPLHIDLSDAPAGFWSHVKSDGSDIRVVDSDGETQLTGCHLESWDYNNHKGHLWVKKAVPQKGASNTDWVYVYYGNAGASADWDKEGTYDSGYVGVWHLDESSGHYLDATGNNNDSTTEQVTSRTATGKINGCPDFDGVDDRVIFPDIATLDGVAKVTFEAWFKPDTLGDWEAIITKVASGTARSVLQLSGSGYGGNNDLMAILANGANTYGYTNENLISTGAWHHVVLVFDGTQSGNSNRLKVFVNGSQRTLTFSGTIPSTTANTPELVIGIDTPSPAYFFDGLIDEVRVSNVARSAAWIAFAYLSDKGDAGTTGGEESLITARPYSFIM